MHFDLVIPRPHLTHPTVALMLDVLQSAALRADLATLPGYDVSTMGTIIAEVIPSSRITLRCSSSRAPWTIISSVIAA